MYTLCSFAKPLGNSNVGMIQRLSCETRFTWISYHWSETGVRRCWVIALLHINPASCLPAASETLLSLSQLWHKLESTR